MALKGRPPSGRQVVWIIVESIKSSEADAYITSYENLKNMPWYGDNLYQVVAFYWEWIRLRKNMSKDITDNTIRNVLHDEIKQNIHLYDEDLAHYARRKDKSVSGTQHDDYSLAFLESCLYRSVVKSQEIKVKNDTRTALKLGKK